MATPTLFLWSHKDTGHVIISTSAETDTIEEKRNADTRLRGAGYEPVVDAPNAHALPALVEALRQGHNIGRTGARR